MSTQPSDADLALPTLREDLQLSTGAPTVTGKPVWLIFDPVQHQYFEIDYEIFHILSIWNKHKSADALIKAIAEEYGRGIDVERVKEVIQFLRTNSLINDDADGAWKKHWNVQKAREVSPLTWLVHNYLFVRIPLVRPTRFLKAALPLVSFFFTPFFFWVTVITGIVGLYLLSREWDTFVTTFANFFSLEGFLLYGVVLIQIKVFHELGHAFMAARYGCRVPTMGIAFLVMFPVLFTDVTDAWRLRSRRQRLLIGSAGMLVELALAIYSTIAWVFLPEGSLKSIAFVVATTSWAMSLIINLNPFMRFDGYYIFADAIGIANLQGRSFAFGRWKLRELLFDLREPAPERLPLRTQRLLYTYAWFVWIYRFFLFLGIALLVYTFFFKVLGVILFIIEIVWFIIRPVWSELKEWPAMYKKIFSRLRIYLAFSMASVAAVLFFFPFSGTVDIPVVVEPERYERVYPAMAARLEKMEVKSGQTVSKNQVLFRFSSPPLDQKLRLNQIRLDLVEARIARATADRMEKTQLLTLERERRALSATIFGLQKEKERLVVTAPFDGVVKDLNPKLHPGRWVSLSDRLVTITKGQRYVARGYLDEANLWRVGSGDRGRFYPDDYLQKPTTIMVTGVSLAGTEFLELPQLSSVYGGKVASRRDEQGKIVPVGAVYGVKMEVMGIPGDTTKVSRGMVHVYGTPESMAARVFRQVLRVLLREAGI